ncbi:hypothetical protein Pan97_25140 [Bremerella volcania]|uniref:Cytochrome c domain-containing protein n=1 Tax=Bremerella volcania TaxID=2527984 RepID=A0A518C8D0_9BACT|nr:DUF1549 domain-containing protein [Bremerella volcania]QDU75481.1 hypothetical protein Pan97_25140 [Bremerella volcania]
MQRVFLVCLLSAIPSGVSALGDQPEGVVQEVNRQLAQLLESNHHELADRTTFLRRASLDLIGRIPTAAEARAFVASEDTETREQAIRRLSRSPAAAKHLATFVRTLWFPQTSVAPYEYLAGDTEAWIADQLNHDRPLNEIAQQLISVSYAPQTSEQSGGPMGSLTTPKTLIEANDHRPERMAANATSSFLGVDLSCAQCHDHPFDAYSQEQFWQTAAFFVPKSRFEENRPWYEIEIKIPDAGKSVAPVLFTGDLPLESESPDLQLTSGREVFATWVGQANNPFFARRTVNQLWAEYFGAPLVTRQPDQIASPVREQALEILAEAWVEHQFDLRWLAETIVSTDAYQIHHRGPATTATDPFPYMTTRGLTGPQLYDSLNIAAGKPPIRGDLDSAEQLHDRQAFLEMFPAYRSVDVERCVTQALSLMNGEKIARLSDPNSNPLVRGLAAAPFLTERECVESLFWSTLNRPPGEPDWQQLRVAGYLEDDPATRAQRLGDLFWVLVNSVEFNTNH